MNKLLRSCLVLSTALVLATGGCAWSKPESSQVPKPPKQAQDADEDHLNITKNHIIFSVSKKPKYFPKSLIVPAEGKVVAGIFVSFTNEAQSDLHIDPAFVELTTSDGQKHTYSEAKTQITGKGAFKPLDIPSTYRGGGLVLFEIGEKQQIQSIKYDDKKGNVFEAVLVEGERKI